LTGLRARLNECPQFEPVFRVEFQHDHGRATDRRKSQDEKAAALEMLRSSLAARVEQLC